MMRALVWVALAASARAEVQPIDLEVDATQAARGLQTARLAIPVSPGPLTLRYPQWIQGNHRPSGPVTSLSGLVVSAGGVPVPWQRDVVDMFAFHVDVPAGVSRLDVSFDLLASLGAQAPSSDRKATNSLLVLQWNRLVLYPAGAASDAIMYAPRLRLPEGWQHASSLKTTSSAGGVVAFAPVSLTELIDAPVLAGRHFRMLDLGGSPAVRLNIAADSAAALAVLPQAEQGYRRLVAETRALFGAVHYREYDFLLALSESLGGIGLEHHRSTEITLPPGWFKNWDDSIGRREVIAHELTHSWNGKYRRPADLWTPDFQSRCRTACSGSTRA